MKLQNRATNIHTSHALSMDVLLGKGLELGSHGSDCWPHVFTYDIFKRSDLLELINYNNNDDSMFFFFLKKVLSVREQIGTRFLREKSKSIVAQDSAEER